MIKRPVRIRTPFDERRQQLAEHLQLRGIYDVAVLDAIRSVPRERFIPAGLQSQAYEDSALPIDERQTISQPFTVAFMTQCLSIVPGVKVLEIGTGSGYQAAVLAHMGAHVVTIERIPKLSQQAKQTLTSLGYAVECRIGDGTIGYRGGAPYHAIIVTAGAPDVPEILARQLHVGGKMVVPVGTMQHQQLYVVERLSEDDWKAQEMGGFTFVPLIGVEGWDDNGG